MGSRGIRIGLLALALLCATAAAGVMAAGGLAAKSTEGQSVNPQGTLPWIPGDGDDEDNPIIDPNQPILHVHVYQHWNGSVQATNLAPGLINCPSACRRNIPAGTKVTLEETPTGPGITFDHWSGATCESPTTQTTSTCTITMPTSGEVQLVAHYTGQYIDPTPVSRDRDEPPVSQDDGEPSCADLFDGVDSECELSPLCAIFGYIGIIVSRPECGSELGGDV
jgi:List-Bact-rpt repeat protein